MCVKINSILKGAARTQLSHLVGLLSEWSSDYTVVCVL